MGLQDKHHEVLEEYNETIIGGTIFFEGKLNEVYKGLDDLSVLYLVNGGQYMKDFNLNRSGLNFQGWYEILDIWVVREHLYDEYIKENYTKSRYKESDEVKLYKRKLYYKNKGVKHSERLYNQKNN